MAARTPRGAGLALLRAHRTAVLAVALVALIGITVAVAATSSTPPVWLSSGLPTAVAHHGVSFTDASDGFAVGAEGAIEKTVDGGQSWTSASSGTTATLFAVDFATAGHG